MTRDRLMSELLTGCQMPLFDLRIAAHSEIERLTRRLEWISAHASDEATKDFAKMALIESGEASE
jgi:hypothetical protein